MSINCVFLFVVFAKNWNSFSAPLTKPIPFFASAQPTQPSPSSSSSSSSAYGCLPGHDMPLKPNPFYSAAYNPLHQAALYTAIEGLSAIYFNHQTLLQQQQQQQHHKQFQTPAATNETYSEADTSELSSSPTPSATSSTNASEQDIAHELIQQDLPMDLSVTKSTTRSPVDFSISGLLGH